VGSFVVDIVVVDQGTVVVEIVVVDLGRVVDQGTAVVPDKAVFECFVVQGTVVVEIVVVDLGMVVDLGGVVDLGRVAQERHTLGVLLVVLPWPLVAVVVVLVAAAMYSE